jgi:L-fucose isomerase-like protein
MTTHDKHDCSCSSSGCCGVRVTGVTRRRFMAGAGAATLGGALYAAAATKAAAGRARPNPAPPRPLRMQPVLVYKIAQRRQGTTWRTWSGLITEAHADEERARIRAELEVMAAKADFPLEVLPLVSVRDSEEAKRVAAADHDGIILYHATDTGNPYGGITTLMDLLDPAKLNVEFTRHRSGPAYRGYIFTHPQLLRQRTDEFQNPGNMNVQDVVVDDYDELLWRLRALNGVKGIRGKRIVCIGGAAGWGARGREAPACAADRWGMEFAEVSYEELGARIAAARGDRALVDRCANEARAYLEAPGVTLLPFQDELTTAELLAGKGRKETLGQMRGFVERAFLLTEVFKDLMAEHQTDAVTVAHCMSAILPVAETTACLTLTLLNDSGCLAFCESDFVAIPSGILLHYIAARPVFFCNPTFPHRNMVTVGHCSAPRKMDGKNLEPVFIRTHFESDYGAAPRVEMRRGQELTVLVPNFANSRWIGFRGRILEKPTLDVCTSQLDVGIDGDCARLADEMGGFHWMLCYGDYLRETGYALRKAGIEWLNLSEKAT